MPRSPRLIASAPYWALVLGSLAAVVAGAALSLPALDTMTSTLVDGSATGVEVYSGQAVITLGAPILGAGLVGLALAAALAAARTLAARPAPEAAGSPADPIASPDEGTDAIEDETVPLDETPDAPGVTEPDEALAATPPRR